MATLWNLVLVVSLLVLSEPQRCSGVNHDSALMVKGQTNVQNEDINSVKTQLAALQREDELSEEIAELKKQLANRDKMVEGLPEELARLKSQLDNIDKIVRHLEDLVSNHTIKEELLSNKVEELQASNEDLENKIAEHDIKVQVLEKRIIEYQEKEKPEKTLEQLNNTVVAEKNDTRSALERMPHGQEIIRLVQQFNNTKDWGSLRRGLEAVLDHSSEPCIQLQHIDYSYSTPLSYVGSHGFKQLVSLLLDAGLPVDTAGASGHTMLHGAAGGGQLQMVKLLLDRGASVDVRSQYARTPLMYAAYWDQLEVVQLLVSAGADTTVTDTYSITALGVARIESRTAVVKYLQQLPH